MDFRHRGEGKSFECLPQGQTETDLVEELTAAQWLQKRCLGMIGALLDTTMDRMEPEIAEELEEIDDGARSALALLNRYSATHARDYHRALDKLRLIQKERRDRNPAPAELRNEPEPVQPKQNHQHPRVSASIGGQNSQDPREPPPIRGYTETKASTLSLASASSSL